MLATLKRPPALFDIHEFLLNFSNLSRIRWFGLAKNSLQGKLLPGEKVYKTTNRNTMDIPLELFFGTRR
jgi:hypothetical protein